MAKNRHVSPGLALICTAAVMGIAPAQVKDIVLHNFVPPFPKGGSPSGVVRDAGGNLYGTTLYGGPGGSGVVYRLDSAGHATVLHSFAGGDSGCAPSPGLIGDSAGNLYGTAGCGTAGQGIVYKLDRTGQYKVLYNFVGGQGDGSFPQAGVIRDSIGNLYGTTVSGGTFGAGTVFRLDAKGRETVLYNFMGGTADGANPQAGVIRDSSGNLYGTTQSGGAAGMGILYRLDPAGGETVLYTFTGGPDGGAPYGVIRDSAGNFYGTAYLGGTGYGVIYRLDVTGGFTPLFTFTGGSDGRPSSGVIRDSAGNLFGTAQLIGTAGYGLVYKLDSAGNFTVLYTFTSEMSGSPSSGVVSDPAGNLYGTTEGSFSAGGSGGTVYRLDTMGQETALYTFAYSVTDGCDPLSAVIRDPDGNLYGTTLSGGRQNLGTVYKLDTTGHETVLHTFEPLNGMGPMAGVIRDAAGNLFGTATYTSTGGGAIYKLDTTGNYTVLYRFTGAADGANPQAGLIRDSAGNLYGTTSNGGLAGQGVVYKVDATGHETVLYSFTGGTDGAQPYAGVVSDANGNLYGTTSHGGGANAGVIYRLDSSGNFAVLYSFTGGTDGAHAQAGVMRDAAGNLFGTTADGGSGNSGVLYKLDASGTYTVLYAFTGATDGANPQAGVIRDSAGNLYGTTVNGGSAGRGVVYELSVGGVYTVLESFDGGGEGGSPYAGLLMGPGGNLYGTGEAGGKYGGGVLFVIKGAAAAP